MPNIVSPFLDESTTEDNDTNLNDNPTSHQDNQQQQEVKIKKDTETKASTPIVENGLNMANNKEDDVVEIKKEGKALKNIIIILIILLILAILGLILYNFFANKTPKDDTPSNGNAMVERSSTESITEKTNFEMTGEEFKASSVIVD